MIHSLGWKALKSDSRLLRDRQMARTDPFFPPAHAVPRVDDRRVISGLVQVIKHGNGKKPQKEQRPPSRYP